MKDVYELMELFNSLSIQEMELEYHGMKIAMRKEAAENNEVQIVQSEPKVFSVEVPAKEIISKSESLNWKEEIERKKAREKEIEREVGEVVKAPLAGTFYRSPAPGETPYVSVGQKVKAGQVLGIIEAMKMMNEILASEDGVVEEILVEDESMVEYGQPLIVIG